MNNTIDAVRARIRFAVVFAVVAGVLLTLYSFPYAAHGIREGYFFSRYLSFYARMAGAALRLGDRCVYVSGMELVGRTSLTVAKNCDAMDVNILFAAAILAFPAAWARRAAGIAIGVAVLVVTNVLRIVTLYFVAVHLPRSFEFVHAEIWPFAMVAVAVSEFMIWSRWAVRGAGAAAQ